MHERLNRDEDITAGSEKGFGIVFAVFFLVVALWPLLDGGAIRMWSVAVAATFLGCAYLFPAILSPLNIVWFKFAMLLYKVVNPLTMAMLFFTTVLPIGLIMRASGKDILNLKLDRDAESYWIERDPPGPEPETMKRQF